MKLVGRIIASFFLVLSGLLSLVFAFIEIRFIFAGDFLLMNTPALYFISYLLRFIFFIALGFFNISLLINIISQKGISAIYLVFAPIFFISSLFSIIFYSTFIYLLVIFIALVPSIALIGKKITM